MSVLFVLIGISLILSALFVAICIVSIRSGQFDDLESPRWRVLFPEGAESLPPAPRFETNPQSRNGT
jgi:cbb3-type cytochrome oxidase maturation protein